MDTKHVTHATKQSEKSPYITIQSNLFLEETSTDVRPHQSSIYFCMNQFYEFHRLELQNLIFTYFKTFYK